MLLTVKIEQPIKKDALGVPHSRKFPSVGEPFLINSSLPSRQRLGPLTLVELHDTSLGRCQIKLLCCTAKKSHHHLVMLHITFGDMYQNYEKSPLSKSKNHQTEWAMFHGYMIKWPDLKFQKAINICSPWLR